MLGLLHFSAQEIPLPSAGKILLNSVLKTGVGDTLQSICPHYRAFLTLQGQQFAGKREICEISILNTFFIYEPCFVLSDFTQDLWEKEFQEACKSCRDAQGFYSGSRVIRHLGGEWTPIALQGQHCWRENTAQNTSSRDLLFIFFHGKQTLKIRQKSPVNSKVGDVKDGMVWKDVRAPSQLFLCSEASLPSRQLPGLPMGKSMDVVKAAHRTYVKTSWFSLSQNILCIIYRYDQWHFNKRELPQQLKSRETRQS